MSAERKASSSASVFEPRGGLEVDVETLVERALRPGRAGPRVGGDLLGECLGFGHERIGLDDPVDQPDPFGLLRTDVLRPQGQVQRPAQPHDPWQEIGHPAGGAETEGVSGSPNWVPIAANRTSPSTRARSRRPVRSHGPRQRSASDTPGTRPRRACSARSWRRTALVHAGHRGDVATGRERAPTTGQDRSADRLERADVLDSLEEAVQHLGVDGVELVRPIEVISATSPLVWTSTTVTRRPPSIAADDPACLALGRDAAGLDEGHGRREVVFALQT